MGIRLSIEVTSPLGPEDKELLTGVAIMTLAIANHEMAKEHFPGTFPDEEEPTPPPCGVTDDEGRVCVSEVGHKGRHRFRALVTTDGLPN
jgi:hypothetical protein